MTKKLPPIHPGEVLREEFMAPRGLTANALAIALHVPATRINEIVREKRAISAETAIRLGRYFDVSAQFWTNMQAKYDLDVAEDTVGAQIAREVRVMAHALNEGPPLVRR